MIMVLKIRMQRVIMHIILQALYVTHGMQEAMTVILINGNQGLKIHHKRGTTHILLLSVHTPILFQVQRERREVVAKLI